MTIGTAMVLAAGFGTRMRPLTLTRPKPLVQVGGKALIDYGMDRLRQAGVKRAIVNVHYLADQIEDWARIQTDPRVEISDERAAILDTGGGIALALPRLGNTPFFVINSDSFWLDVGEPALQRLSRGWNETVMDCLLLLCPIDRTVGYDGAGDFCLGADGRVTRENGRNHDALVFIGAQIVHPRLFAGAPAGRFSMNLLWDRAIESGRLFGVSHGGRWIHVGTPEAIAAAEAVMRE